MPLEINRFVVTALKPATRDKTRINVFVGGKFSFSLTLAQLSDAGLKVGQFLDEEKISALKSESDFGKLYQRSLEYALTRPHSEKEVRDYLQRKKTKREIAQKRYDAFQKRLDEDPEYRAYVADIRAKVQERNSKISGKDFTEDNRYEYRGKARTNFPTKPGAPISEADIERVVERLKQDRAVDDMRFTRYFVENRRALKGTSFKKLKLELRYKGISEQMIKEALAPDEFGDVLRDENAELEKVILRKRKRGIDDKKLIPYLLRQGFPYGLVKEKLREMDSQNSEQNLDS